MIKKWKKISSKEVFSHPRHSVFIDEVELPDGNRTEYLHFGKINDASMVIAKRKDGKILLQKEYSYPPDEILWQFPGGLLENEETPEQGALRELGEEAHLRGDLKYIGWMYLDNRRKNQKMHFFIAENLVKFELEKDPQEFFEDFWLSEREIDELIRNNEISNYTALSGWALYKSKMN